MEKLVDIVHFLHLEIHESFGSAGMHFQTFRFEQIPHYNSLKCLPFLHFILAKYLCIFLLGQETKYDIYHV